MAGYPWLNPLNARINFTRHILTSMVIPALKEWPDTHNIGIEMKRKDKKLRHYDICENFNLKKILWSPWFINRPTKIFQRCKRNIINIVLTSTSPARLCNVKGIVKCVDMSHKYQQQ